MEYYSALQQSNPSICNNTGRAMWNYSCVNIMFTEHYAKWNKQDVRSKILHDLTLWKVNSQIHESRRENGSCRVLGKWGEWGDVGLRVRSSRCVGCRDSRGVIHTMATMVSDRLLDAWSWLRQWISGVLTTHIKNDN